MHGAKAAHIFVTFFTIIVPNWSVGLVVKYVIALLQTCL
jgi:hypothetical protein